MFSLQAGQTGQRVLPIEQRQLLVNLWVHLVQQVGGAEEIFAGNGKELGRVFCGNFLQIASTSG